VTDCRRSAVALAALWSGLRRLPSQRLGSSNLLFVGEAGMGIGALVVAAMMRDGMAAADAEAISGLPRRAISGRRAPA
jgi:hypothetical protein